MTKGPSPTAPLNTGSQTSGTNAGINTGSTTAPWRGLLTPKPAGSPDNAALAKQVAQPVNGALNNLTGKGGINTGGNNSVHEHRALIARHFGDLIRQSSGKPGLGTGNNQGV